MKTCEEVEPLRDSMLKLRVPRYSGNWREDYKVLLI
jgi:hypothetical protein